jgi:hypothetical protein
MRAARDEMLNNGLTREEFENNGHRFNEMVSLPALRFQLPVDIRCKRDKKLPDTISSSIDLTSGCDWGADFHNCIVRTPDPNNLIFANIKTSPSRRARPPEDNQSRRASSQFVSDSAVGGRS